MKVWKIPWRRKQQSTPVLLPGKSHGQRSLIGYSPWGCKESDMTEQLHFPNQTKESKHYMIWLICKILKNDRNECICKTDSRKTNQQFPKEIGKGRVENQGYGAKRHQLLYIKQRNRDILYSTGNYSYYLMITFNRV